MNGSIAAYRAVGNPRGEADVDRDLGNLLSDTNPKRAQEEYRRSLAAFQALGDQNGVAVLVMLLAVYGLLFLLLQLEDYALLVGSVAAFLLLAVTMFATLRVNWWNGSRTGD